MPLHFRPEKNVVQSNTPAFNKPFCYEHVAGPSCRNRQAYHGKNISVEEMWGCHTVQCILWKNPGSSARSDDLEFERGSNYFLTGVAETMPSSGSWLDFYPVRYGADNYIDAETNFVLETTQDELRSIALPFHPHYFELYIQATRLYNDRIDLGTLVHIRDKACIEEEKFPVSYNEDVQAATMQVWQHMVGHEYLVAIPIFVPGLRYTLESAISTEESFNVHNSAFKQRPQQDSLSSKDPFLALPLEIILDIASSLDSYDVAAVRLASRAFTHLPISFFRYLLLDEMPWLYEAWSPETSPYPWVTAVAHDMLKAKRELEEFNRELERRRKIISDFDLEIYDEFVANEPKWEWPEHPERREMLDMGPTTPPRDRTNWYMVFCGIRSNWAELKGLRDRERIWRNVTLIVDAIKKARDRLDFI